MDTVPYMSDADYQHMLQQMRGGDFFAMDNAFANFGDGEVEPSSEDPHALPSIFSESNEQMPSNGQYTSPRQGDMQLDLINGDDGDGQSRLVNDPDTTADEASQVPHSMGELEAPCIDFPSFDEMANQGWGLNFDNDLDFESALNDFIQATPQQDLMQLNNATVTDAATTQDDFNAISQGLASGMRLPNESWTSQAPVEREALWIPINLKSAIAPSRNCVPGFLVASSPLHAQSPMESDITTNADWTSYRQDHPSTINTYTTASGWNHRHSHDGMPRHFPPSLPRRPATLRSRHGPQHRLATPLPGRAVPTLGPNVGYPADEVYSSRPLVNPSVPSTDVSRINPRYKPSQPYVRVPRTPRPWNVFRYNQYGELDPAQLYTPNEVMTYLFDHPLHAGHDPKTSSLHILVQRNPPSARHRYPTLLSNRCRFSDCPHPTINQGHTRVAFNESSITTADQDPLISAGFVHLWCLERYCDLPRIISELNFSGDTRYLEFEWKQLNPMRLALTNEKTKDVSYEEIVLNSFIQSCRDGSLDPKYPRYDQPNRPHEGTLIYQLAAEKLKREPKSVARQRERRIRLAGYEGSTLTTHLGDLELEATKRKSTRRHQNQNQRVNKPTTRRMYFNDDKFKDDSDDDADGESAEESSDDEDCPAAEVSGKARVPVAQMTARTAQQSVIGTKRSRDNDDEVPPPKRRMAVSDHPPPFPAPTPPVSDHISLSPSRVISNSPIVSPNSRLSTSSQNCHGPLTGPPRSHPVKQSMVGHLAAIAEQPPMEEDKETKIRRLKQHLQMLEAQESGNILRRGEERAIAGVGSEIDAGEVGGIE